MFLLRLKLLLRLFSWRSGPQGRANLFILFLFAIFVMLTSNKAAMLFDTLRSAPEVGEALSFRVVAMANLTFMVMLVFSALVSGAMILYFNPENDLLYSLPMSERRIFNQRFIESMAAAAWMVFLFGTPIASGLGRSFYAGWDYVLLAGLALLGLTIPPTALGALVLCLTFVVVPRHRAKTLLLALGVLVAFTLVHFSARIDIGTLFDMEIDPYAKMSAVLKAIEIPTHPLSPDSLAAQSLAHMVRGYPGEAWKTLGILWAQGLAALAVGLVIGFPLYRIGRRRTIERAATLTPFIRFDHDFLRRRPWLALCLKDLKYFFRDVTQWSQVLILLGLIFVHIINIRDLPLDEIYLRNAVAFVNLIVVGLLISAISVRFVYPSFSLEGDGMYVLRAAPLSAAHILRAKFWANAAPLIVIGQSVLAVANAQAGVSWFFSLFSHLVTLIMTAAIVWAALWIGLVLPPSSRSSVERAAGSTGGILLMILSAAYVIASATAFATPLYRALLRFVLDDKFMAPVALMVVVFAALHVAVLIPLTRHAARKFQNG